MSRLGEEATLPPPALRQVVEGAPQSEVRLAVAGLELDGFLEGGDRLLGAALEVKMSLAARNHGSCAAIEA